MDIYNGMRFQNAKGYWWEVVDCSVSRKIIVKSLESVPYTTVVRKEAIQKKAIMYPYGTNQYGGYRGEGVWDVSTKNPYLSLWQGVLLRAKDDDFKQKNPAYVGVDISDEWLCLQNFCNWCEKYKPKDSTIKWELDKDLLGDGTTYSPNDCCFLPKEVNLFLAKKDIPPIYEHKCEDGRVKYRLWVREGKGQKGNHYVGSYDSREEAMDIWKQKKNARLLSLIEKYKCVLPRHVTDALYSLMK